MFHSNYFNLVLHPPTTQNALKRRDITGNQHSVLSAMWKQRISQRQTFTVLAAQHTHKHTHNSYLMVTEGAAAAAPPPCKSYSSRMSAQQQLHKTVHSSPQTHYASALRLSYCYNGQPSNSSTNTAARRLVTVRVLSRVKSTV